MPIAYVKYVGITSAVGGAGGVSQRELILRIFTTNDLVPTETLVEFTGAADARSFFGSASEEYKRALTYFSWISKQYRTPGKIGYQRWADAATAPHIYGAVGTYVLGGFTPIGAGSFTLILGAVSHAVPLDLSAAGSLAAVAAAVQAAIRTAGSASGAGWTGATVVYDATRGSFQFTSGLAGAAAISITDGAETPAAALGWLPAGVGPNVAMYSDGVAVETITDVLDLSAQASNNFGTFLFTYAAALTLSETEEAQTWNEAANVSYLFLSGVSAANASTWSAAMIAVAGLGMTLVNSVTYPAQYPEQSPAMVAAATDYTRPDASQNYMFQSFPDLTALVTDTLTSNTYDNERINYYGNTQTAGNVLSFYQRGVLTGGVTAPLDMNVYVNEMWLKDALAAALMNLLLNATRVPVNNQGKGMILAVMTPVVQLATVNGVIAPGKPFTTTQIAVVTNLTDDPNAWHQVQNIGWWLEVEFESYVTDDDRTEWKALYVLVYSKDDLIRKIEGSDVLI